MNTKFFAAALVSLTLSACANHSGPQRNSILDEGMSSIETVDSNAASLSFESVQDGNSTLQTGPISNRNRNAIAYRLADYCVKQQGRVVKFNTNNPTYPKAGFACQNSKNQEFFAVLADKTNNGSMTISEGKDSAALRAALRTQGGYLTPEEQAAEQAYYDKLRIEKEKYIIQVRGTQVCQSDAKGISYIGFVEDSEGSRIKVTIQNAFITGAPSIHPGGFQPSQEWAEASTWRICKN